MSDKKDYSPSSIEKKWQEIWNKNRIYSPNLDKAKKPFYNLMMFPYPSAEGMHVGNMYAFTGADVYGRFMRMKRYDVFEPIGLDGFGIHSENYAIKVGRHPKEQAKISEKNFYRQLRATGNGFDWSRKVETYGPKYYKWTQWLFIQLFKAGLAYRKKAPVNFCPSDKTVLADEQVIQKVKNTSKNSKVEETIAVCERCETPVEKRELEQWFFKITKYAERLLANLTKLDWSEKVKIAQRQWIGKSEGARISFPVILEGAKRPIGSHGDSIASLQNDNQHKIEVFTTRPDTLYGATFLVLSPEHDLVNRLIKNEIASSQASPDPRNDNLKEIKKYIENAKKKTEQEIMAEGKEKTGVFTGLYAINPANKENIPIWIADYVLMGYGTGAIMAVPAHDQRDFEFAKKYNLAIKNVIAIRQMTEKQSQTNGIATSQASPDPRNDNEEKAYVGEGTIVNSGEWNGWRAPEEIGKVIDWIEKKGIGKREVQYHLRDWLISRQRYWGSPIPMIYCETCAKRGSSWSALTKKSSTKEDYLVNLKADSLNGWPDTLEDNISKQNKNVNGQFRKGMDSPGVENIPAEPMPESVYKKDDESVNNWNSAGWFPVPEKDLPVLLPDVKDWKPTGTGKSPLASLESFVNTTCPNCKGSARRETDVSDTFLDSSWYFFRYTSTDIDSSAFDIDRVKKWLPVDMYIGGAEHSVLHLLYSRFITMALCDLGFTQFEEPFSRFYAHGLLIKEKAKMSKSRGNVVVPDEYIKKYGADTLRMYLMFLGPFSQGGDFYDTALEGMHRFVKRVWKLIIEHLVIASEAKQSRKYEIATSPTAPRNDIAREGYIMMHKTIKKVTEDIEHLRYNTAIAALMEWHNYLKSKINPSTSSGQKSKITKEETKVFLKLLAPFAPHMAEELFQQFFGNSKFEIRNSKFSSVHLHPWPKFDPKFLEEDEVTIVVQVDGKLRDTIKNQKSILRQAQDKNQKYVEELAQDSKKVRKYIEGKAVKKVVYVEGKIINFVTE